MIEVSPKIICLKKRKSLILNEKRQKAKFLEGAWYLYDSCDTLFFTFELGIWRDHKPHFCCKKSTQLCFCFLENSVELTHRTCIYVPLVVIFDAFLDELISLEHTQRRPLIEKLILLASSGARMMFFYQSYNNTESFYNL